MNSITNLTNCFLIAMPHLKDPGFYRAVTYICEHNEQGALGFVINRPMGISLHDIFKQMSIHSENRNANRQIVYAGGPVQIEQGFVIHGLSQSNWQSTINLSDELHITTSRDILTAIAANEGPNHHMILLGYSGWGAGQLEKEIANNYWLIGPSRASIFFDIPPTKRWHAAAALIGVNIDQMSIETGHG